MGFSHHDEIPDFDCLVSLSFDSALDPKTDCLIGGIRYFVVPFRDSDESVRAIALTTNV